MRWFTKKGSFRAFFFFYQVLFCLVCLQHCTDSFYCSDFYFVSFVTEHEDPAAPLDTDASIVYRGRGGAYQTSLPVCPPPNMRGGRMDSSVENVHLYINVFGTVSFLQC